ncbi:MAG TPA: archaeosortase/exosortase family protein [Bacteroidia bacterium]|nr:archaeosortase/exosortase family protein [Bacteroidia bacterium]
MRAPFKLNAFALFLIKACALYLVLFLLHQFVVRRYTYYDQKFISLILNHAEALLRFLGFATFKVLQDRDMQVMGIDGSNGVWVGSNCNAISLFSLFSVFVLAYPGAWRHKAWFIPLGILAIHLINVLRVAALAIIAKWDYTWLDFNHTYTFTLLVYGFIFGLWMVWVKRFGTVSNHNNP